VLLPVLKRVLRHRDPKLTASTSGHLERNRLLEEVDRLRLLPEQTPVAEPEAANWRQGPSERY